MTKIRQGTRVLVPRHGKQRGEEREYDAGSVAEVSKGFAAVALDRGHLVHIAVGLLTVLTGEE